MANKRSTGTRSAVIRCPNCGEDYSVTYKRCPFCDEKAEDERRKSADYAEDMEEESRNGRGGRRLAGQGGRRGGPWTPLRIAGTVVPLVIIAAAIWIVVTQIMPLVNRGEIKQPADTAPVTTTQGVEESTLPTESGMPEDTTAPESTPPETASPEPAVPAGQTDGLAPVH